MIQYELKGGARIGKANATYPLAKLKVTHNKLELNASIIGNLAFAPADVISIEPYQQIPILGQGVKINHRVSNYNGKVIFWTFKNPKQVIDEIRKTGFLDNINSTITSADEAILAKQEEGSFPIKKPFAIGAILVWNLLFAVDFISFIDKQERAFMIGSGIKTALGLVFVTSLITLLSKPFQKLILKEGRKLDDIKTVLYLVMVVSFFMLVGFTVLTST